ncbi:MAG: hypothetical protein JST52_05050 [Bacteroidetes bacterium]|nr:hypothetical protein [Bacteroidota bacterium]MBS1739282.1 hypothetical protein [Bacteroidota bacterium]MBS1775582.1 hypothetical protein [Bacteroidota bacterium]
MKRVVLKIGFVLTLAVCLSSCVVRPFPARPYYYRPYYRVYPQYYYSPLPRVYYRTPRIHYYDSRGGVRGTHYGPRRMR